MASKESAEMMQLQEREKLVLEELEQCEKDM
jgi:hypothetical protein